MSAATSGAFAMQAPEGDSGFVALYRTHASFTWACLRRLGVPPAAIDDAMQELWVTAHRRMGSLHGPASAKAWLYGIARRVASHHRRSERRHRRKLDALGAAPAREEASREDELVIESILAQLDARVREAFVLSELEGWSAPEIARATGANTNTIYWRVRVARQELQSQLGEAAAGAQVISLRDATRAPRGVARHCWVFIAPKLGKASVLAGVFGAFGVGKAIAIGALVTVGAVSVIDFGLREERGGMGAGAGTSTFTSTSTTTTTTTTTTTPTTPAVVPAGKGATPLQQALPVPARVRASASASPSVSVSVSASAPASPSRTSSDDTGLLGDAKLAFAEQRWSDATVALAAHRDAFPDSRLADVRDLLEVEVRCATGDEAKAQQIAGVITARAPASAAARKLASTCVGGQ
ncbi:MAG TPA: sigma-70 family RNA polymerase sigma factor [Nannocystaceae bacterium]|nr:sigma-70 family RNA polymerase sigma factor [Nannocystaceae bacterium]